MKYFLNTMFASYLKVFITAILVQYIANGIDVFDYNTELLQTLFSAAIASTLPVIINALNPADPRYGTKKDVIVVDKETGNIK